MFKLISIYLNYPEPNWLCNYLNNTLNTNINALIDIKSFPNSFALIEILHTGNTRPFCMCGIQEHQYYIMSLGKYHGCCQYHKSMSRPRVVTNTMSPYLYHESMSNPWVNVYTMSPCWYHKSDSIPWVHVYTMSLCQINAFIFIPWGIQFSDIKKYK